MCVTNVKSLNIVTSGIDVPKDFSLTRQGRVTFFLKEKYEYPVLKQTLMDFSFKLNEESSAFVGRRPCVAIPVNGLKDKRLIIRHYSHGGLWGRLAGDVLWGQSRPLKELFIAERALEQNVDTSEVVALRFTNIFGPLCRADIFTIEISGGEDFIAFLTCRTEGDVLSHKRKLIRHTARAVRRMHDAGIYHADLHLKNILAKVDDGCKVYIIDLDKSELRSATAGGGLSIEQRMDNILRLDRSVEKFGEWKPGPGLVTRADRLRFLRDYLRGCTAEGVTDFSDWKVLARKYATRHVVHRLWWRLLGVMGIGLYDFEGQERQ